MTNVRGLLWLVRTVVFSVQCLPESSAHIFISQLGITQWLITSLLSALAGHSSPSPASSFQGEFILPVRTVCCQIAGKLKCSLILSLQHQKASHPFRLTKLLALKPKASSNGAWLLITGPLFSVLLCQDHLTGMVLSLFLDLLLSWGNWYFWWSSLGFTISVTGGILYISFNHRLLQIRNGVFDDLKPVASFQE